MTQSPTPVDVTQADIDLARLCVPAAAIFAENEGHVADMRRRAAEHIARHRLTTLRQQAGNGAPEGWRLVPVEPTDAMMENLRRLRDTGASLRNLWDAALTASPQPPEPTVSADAPDMVVAVAEAARDFCAEVCEDSPDVPQPQLKALHAALDAWEGIATPKTPDAPEKVVAGEWQPIETAPHGEAGDDEPTLLLLYEPHDAGGFAFVGAYSHLTFEWFNNLDLKVQHPTHWMPLPATPKADAPGAQS